MDVFPYLQWQRTPGDCLNRIKEQLATIQNWERNQVQDSQIDAQNSQKNEENLKAGSGTLGEHGNDRYGPSSTFHISATKNGDKAGYGSCNPVIGEGDALLDSVKK